MTKRLIPRQTRIRTVAAFTIACTLASSGAAGASTLDHHYPPDGDNPLRIVYYFVAPVGVALEWTVTRPLAVMGDYIAPYEHINRRGFTGCSRERPARSCTNVIK